MKRTKISKLLAILFIGGVLATGCNDVRFDEPEAPEYSKGYVTLAFSLAPGTRATSTVDGETSNENKINTVDLFFYGTEDGDGVKAKYAMHDPEPEDVHVSVKKLTEAFGDVTTCKVVAVVNCDATEALTAAEKYPTINDLKQTQLSAKNTKDGGIRDFRSAEAPEDFVMTNLLTHTTEIAWNEDGGLEDSYTIELKRVAAKIRVALNVEESITENGVEWKVDKDDIRLFISNGVTKGQLDGSHIELTAPDDYYSIATSGSTGEESAYALSREVNKPESGKTASGAPATDSEEFPYYNEIPYYTYPNQWENSMMDNTQTKLTIVVPWTKKEGDTETYHPTYYTVPVNNGTTIESNKYYYLRMHIGMIGSLTPELPMPVDMECDIADWIETETHANIRPVRFLIFNQKDFVMNNTREITIPFSSTHLSRIVSCKVTYYTYDHNDGEHAETPIYSGTSNSNFPYEYGIDGNNVWFNHNFFKNTSNGTIKYNYTKCDVEIVVQHNTGNTQLDAAYKETINITVYPVIYISADPLGSSSTGTRGDGWHFINGYDGGTRLGDWDASSTGKVLTTLTITQLEPEDAVNWSIDDPRTYYIHNELDNASMLDDTKDYTNIVWSNNGGPYNGTNHSGTSSYKNECRTIWQYYDENLPDRQIPWSGGIWDIKTDKWTQENKRTLSYYYPAAEQEDKGDLIAPKITIASGHATSGGLSRENARRRCASYQQWGYPAGRWRIPTKAEALFIRKLQARDAIDNVFIANGAWTNVGEYNVNTGSYLGGSSAVVRCVYDSWYWEQVDANGTNFNKIPDPDGTHENWKYFTWGDRPKQNPLVDRPDDSDVDGHTRAAGSTSFTVQDFLQKNAPGNYAVIRDGENVRLEKLETVE